MPNSSKYAPIFQKVKQKKAPQIDVENTDTSNGLTNSPSFCVSSQTMKQSAAKPVQLGAKTTPIPETIETAAMRLGTKISLPKPLDMPVLIEDETMPPKPIKPPKPYNSLPVNEIPQKMVSICLSTNIIGKAFASFSFVSISADATNDHTNGHIKSPRDNQYSRDFRPSGCNQ